MDNTPKHVELGKPTIYPNIIWKDGRYIPTGIDPYFDFNMSARIEWMNQTDGGQNIQPGDNSLFAHEVWTLGLPPKHEASVSPTGGNKQFAWLGDPTNMEYTGKGDFHHCLSCRVEIGKYVPGDTFLNQHAYFTGGECPYLKNNYTHDRLKVEIGQERFRRGFVAYPDAILPPDTWKRSTMELTNGIYVTLAPRQWCHMRGRPAGEHKPSCHQKTTKTTSSVRDPPSNPQLQQRTTAP